MSRRPTQRTRVSRFALWLGILALACAAPALAAKPVDPKKDKKQEESKQREAPPAPTARKATVEPTAKPAAKPDPTKATTAPEAAGKAGVVPRPKTPLPLPKKKTAAGDETVVITNDDLTRIYGRSRAKPKSPDYTDLLKDADRQKKQRQRQQATQTKGRARNAERKAQIEAELDRLKKKLLGLRNPLLPRGKSSEDEAKREQGKSNVDRVRMTKEQIRRLEDELARLQ